MDIAQSLGENDSNQPIRCIDMHTTGEPTRIVYSGFPPLSGTLLEQRDQAKQQQDHIRKRLMLEPRGHNGMYGAIIRPETELVSSGAAHIGVLFIHNEGFSTMCGHATIALGRFLVDTHDHTVFPHSQTKHSRPCGLVRVTVPVTADGRKSDPSRPVAFLSTPAFATRIQMAVPIAPEIRWPELRRRDSIVLDVSYGGAFYAIVQARELGFSGGLRDLDLDAVTSCVQKLKPYLMSLPEVQAAVRYPHDQRLSFLYSVMVVDDTLGFQTDDVQGTETGLCYFAENQIDRSPTGSCVTARMALACAKGVRSLAQRWVYNSLVSNHFGAGVFSAEIVEELTIDGVDDGGLNAVIVQVEGQAFYTGASVFVVENEDRISSSGFTMEKVALGPSMNS
ncbi:putative proline racemase [Aspergillus novofumigatus IBT 16806]|uniref:trans-L-3-hydroxyproline dehydratase n=1 Tax=Aspergillus novofumigatus (strain IBT 16806) TaxID=1392255 RepID=A0A2I1CFS1_ASPN1|nr:putative proline racemase [Aspergillus novofumigatus IBT 16806]PKX96479.1 putative proline racemase [Aspergillus novofumigatus IBT 16806]